MQDQVHLEEGEMKKNIFRGALKQKTSATNSITEGGEIKLPGTDSNHRPSG
jgi:hypothetical protein